jgi:hypothetical protein
MEAFEHVCKVALEAEGFVVTSNLKFQVRQRTRKAAYPEFQEHGYEIDLVAARGRQLILAEVKSFFGSAGVSRQGFKQLAQKGKRTHFERYKLFNNPLLRRKICNKACEQFGYRASQLKLRMYVGKFANGQEGLIRKYLKSVRPRIEVVGLDQVVNALLGLAKKKTYTDDSVVMTVKALHHAGKLAAR